ncbi:MAG: anaerobic ribonucleoside-triphosphate reductase, partial [Mycoplasmatales bacterium]
MNIKNIKENVESIVGSSNQDLIQENANTDGTSPMGIMGLLASVISKEYSRDLLDEGVLEKFDQGYIHIHDFDYYSTGTTTCCQLPLGQILKNGFKVGECMMRRPKSIGSAMALAAILIQSNQNQQHGGQSYPNWDYDLAPYVEITHNKNIKKFKSLIPNLNSKDLETLAWNNTVEDTMQAAEAFVHNANSMLSRNGMQVPFVSVNFGLDTSKYGRLVSKATLYAQEKGLGDGATPLFPILVFKRKSGINTEVNEPNYDLYEQALECLSKRLFPNFQFVDTPFNIDGFKLEDPNTHIATMGCRTRVYTDINGDNSPVGRGNLSFTTLNLPMIAKESIECGVDFITLLDQYLELASNQLLKRLEYQKSRLKSSFKLLYGQGVWKSDTNDLSGTIGDLLNTGTLSVGFIGLAETLVLLSGKHHGESKESQEIGLRIVKHMKEVMDEKTKETNLNFSLLATPAESYSGTSVRKFVDMYGVVENVSDKEFFTNSSHVPVYYDISINDKIRIEAPY